MSWVDDALRAATEHLAREQETDEREAASTVKGMWRLVEALGLRPTAGTARLGEAVPEVRGTVVAFPLKHDRAGYPAELRADVGRGRPAVHLWVQQTSDTWRDFGQVETLTDLGLVLMGERGPEPAAPDDEPTVPELLHQVLTALVTDVVRHELDGRLGDGPA